MYLQNYKIIELDKNGQDLGNSRKMHTFAQNHLEPRQYLGRKIPNIWNDGDFTVSAENDF